MNNNMEQFSQSHSFIACLYGEKKNRCQKNIFHSSAFIPKSRKSPFFRGGAQKQLSKVEATTVTTAHTQTEGTFHCTNPTNPPRNKRVINIACSKLAINVAFISGDEARAKGDVLSCAFHRIQPPHVVGSSSLQKYSMRLQEGGKVPHQIPLQAMSNESKQRNVQVQPCKGRICSNFISMNTGITLRGSCRSD
ncbi:unnamed protein product [Sphagnum balticum]